MGKDVREKLKKKAETCQVFMESKSSKQDRQRRGPIRKRMASRTQNKQTISTLKTHALLAEVAAEALLWLRFHPLKRQLNLRQK